MQGKILLSTAYLPPAGYFSMICRFEETLIEKEENYLKQTFRNRCCILTASGPHTLSVPVYLGSFHKTKIKDIRIDYSKRWQQVHLRALASAYGSSPFYLYYSETIERIIMNNHEFLLDLNMELLLALVRMLKRDARIAYTTDFIPANQIENDFRYSFSPKKSSPVLQTKYRQVFETEKGFIPGLSIVDLIFNMGPESASCL